MLPAVALSIRRPGIIYYRNQRDVMWLYFICAFRRLDEKYRNTNTETNNEEDITMSNTVSRISEGLRGAPKGAMPICNLKQLARNESGINWF
jgi:hypothetical protein